MRKKLISASLALLLTLVEAKISNDPKQFIETTKVEANVMTIEQREAIRKLNPFELIEVTSNFQKFVLEDCVKKIEICTPIVEHLPPRIVKWKDFVDEAYDKIKPRKPIDKCFIYSMIGAESNGYHFVNGSVLTSTAGAVGLMQLLPSTARIFRENPYNPEGNIFAGIKYLNSIVGYLEGKIPNWKKLSRKEQLDMISASYNMGEAGFVMAYLGAEEKREKIKLSSETKKHTIKVGNGYTIIGGRVWIK